MIYNYRDSGYCLEGWDGVNYYFLFIFLKFLFGRVEYLIYYLLVIIIKIYYLVNY